MKPEELPAPPLIPNNAMATQLSFSTHRELNSHMIHDVLSVVNVLSAHRVNIAANPNYKDESNDGDGLTAMDATLIQACARLDTLLADESRWQLPEKDARQIAYELGVRQVNAAEMNNRHNAVVIQAMLQQAQYAASLLAGEQNPQPTAPSKPSKKPCSKKKKRS